MQRKFLPHLIWPAALMIAPLTMRADLITDPSLIPTPSIVIDFSQFTGTNTIDSTPLQVGSAVGVDVTVTSNNPDGSFIGSDPYSLADNGTWQSPLSFAGIDVDFFGGDAYTMTFDFNSGPVSAVGGFFNYASFAGSDFSDFIISALDSSGNVLESYDITQLDPISSPDGLNAVNEGVFLGIVDPTADIAAFSISDSAAVITDLTFSSTSSGEEVPEPSSLALSVFGLMIVLGFNLIRARRGRSGQTGYC